MPLARATSLESLRRLIGDKNYWTPHDPQFEERQRQVREGFGQLYSAKNDATEELNAQIECIRQRQQRYDEILDEYDELIRYAPSVLEYDKDGRLLKDYVPIPPAIEERKRLLNEELRILREELDRLGAPPGIQFKMNNE